MTWIIAAWGAYGIAAAVLLLVLLAGVAVAVARKGQRGRVADPYEACSPLTAAERNFWQVLQQCLPPQHVLLTKVRLADIVGIKKGVDPAARQGYFNRIASKHVDFLLCDAAEMMPRVAIELDDASHRTQRAAERDAQKDRILDAAGIGILRVPARRSYDIRALRESLHEALHPSRPEVSAQAQNERSSDEASAEAEPSRVAGDTDTPPCPRCGAEMVLRVAKQGANRGAQFWGCTSYPNCKGVIKI